MSETLDERVVKLEFDNAKFEKNVKQTQKSLEQLDETLAFKDGSDGIERVEASFSHFQVVAFTIISRLTNKLIDLGVTLVKSLSVDNIAAGWSKFGDKTVSVATMAAQKIKIAGKAIEDQAEKMEVINEQLDKLNWFTDETSYNFTDMVDNIGKFTAAGRSLDESVSAMMGIANWAALSGQNAATASRAMYQLSQALGKGYVQLMDWKSIQTANMDTEEFREKCLETAVAIGELTKEGNTFITKTGKRFTIAEFTESLSSKWLTNDVLLNTLGDYSSAVEKLYEICEREGITATEAMAKYGDELEEFGVKAFKAAQEARTFSDVIASVKDAVSTGWMNTAEKIFGGYEESKETWTELANELYDVFAEGGNFRNEVLGLWRDLGGHKNIFGEHGSANQGAFWNIYDSIIAVRDLIKDAWNDVFGLSSFSDATEQAQEIAEKFNKLTNNIREFTKRIKNTLENNMKLKFVFQGLFNVLKIGIQLINGIRYALDPLVQLAKQLVSFLFDKIAAFGLNLAKIEGTASAIEEVARGINDILTDIIESLDLVGFLDKVFNLLGKIFRVIANLHPLEKLRKLIVAVLDAFKGGASSGISGFFAALSKGLGGVIEFFGKGLSSLNAENVMNPIMSLFLGLSSLLKGVLSVIKPMITILGQVLNFVGVVLQKFGELVSKLISAFNGEEAGKVIKVLLAVLMVLGPALALAWTVYNIVYGILAIMHPLKNLFQAAADMLWDIGASFKIKAMAEVIKSVAFVLLALGASIALIANVPTRGFAMALIALAAIAAFVGALMVFMWVLTKQQTKLKETMGQLRNAFVIQQIAEVLISLGIALLAISWSLKIISGIGAAQLAKSVGTVLLILAALFGMIVGFNKLLDTDLRYKRIEKLMKSIAMTVLALSFALRIIGKMKDENITSAISAMLMMMAGIFGLVVGFNKLLTTPVEFAKVNSLLRSLSLAMINMSIALRIIAGAKNMEAVESGVASMILLMGGLALFMLALKKILKIGVDYAKVGSLMFGLSVSLVVMASALRIVASIKDINNVWTAVGALTAILAAMLVLMFAVNKLGGAIGAKTLGVIIGLVGMSAALVTLALGLAAFSKGMDAVGGINWEAFGKLAVALLVINSLARTGIMQSVSLVIFGAALTVLGIGLGSLAGGMKVLQSVDWGVIPKLMVAMMTIKMFAKAGIIKAAKIAMMGASLTALGIGLASFSTGMKSLYEVEWEAIKKLLVYMMVVRHFAKSGIIKTAKIIMFSAALSILGVALNIFANSLKILDTVSWKALGLLAVTLISLGTLGAVAGTMSGPLMLLGFALIPLAGGLMVMALAMEQMDQVSWSALGKSLVAMAASVLLLATTVKFLVTSYKDMIGMLAVAATFAALGAGVLIFAIAMQKMEGISWMTIIQSLVLMAVAVGLLVAATKILGPSTLLVLALGAAVALLGAGMLMAAMSLQVFAQALPEFLEAIISNVELIALALETIGPVMISALIDAFKQMFDSLGDLVPSIVNLAIELINGLVQVITETGPQLVEAIITIVDNIANSLAEHAESIINAVGKIIFALLKWLKENIKELANDLIDILIKVIDVLISRIPELIQKLCEMLKKLINALFDNIGPVLETLVERTFGFLSEFIPKFIKELMKFTSVLVNSVLVLIANVLQLTIVSLGTLAKLMMDFLAGLILLLVHVGIGMSNVMFQAFRTLLYNAFDLLAKVLISMTTDVPKLIGGALGRVMGAIVSYLGDLVNRYLGGLFGFGDVLKGWGNDITNAASSAFDQSVLNGSNVVAALNTARSNISSTMHTITDAIQEDVTEGVGMITDTLTNSLEAMSSSVYGSSTDVGEDVAKGVAEGMSNGSDDIYTSSSDAAKLAEEAMRKQSETHSPSKVFARIGSDMISGLAIGIANNAELAEVSAVDVMNDTLMAVKEAAEADINDEIVIRPVMDLSDINAGANSISSIMSNVGNGRVSVSGELASSVHNKNSRLATEGSGQNGTTVINNNETYNPVFNITSNDPDEVAREVDIRLQRMHNQSNLAKGGAR